MQNLRHYWQRIEGLADKQSQFGCIYRVRFEDIMVQGGNKISYNLLPNLKSYWNERISYQRTIKHIFLQHEGDVCETVKVYKLIIL